MRHLSTLTLFLVLAGTVLITTALADSHRIELVRSGVVNGFELKTGQYKLVLNGEDTAEIYRGRKLLVKAKVEIIPLGDATPNSISQSQDGTLKEIRLKQERVVFIRSQASAQTSR